MSHPFTFKHDLYEYAGCASQYNKQLASAEASAQPEIIKNIQASRTVFRGWLEAMVSAEVEVSDWFTLKDAQKLLQETDFDWTDSPRFRDWFEQFFQKYRIAIITGKQKPQ